MHALAGSWIANVEQSRRHPNHQFQRATLRFAVSGDRVTLAYGGINASGRHEQGDQTLQADGQEHSLPQAPGVVVVCTLEPRLMRSVGKKDGAVMGRSVYEVSDDGHTMTATVSGIDASGQPFDQVIVFDREAPAYEQAGLGGPTPFGR